MPLAVAGLDQPLLAYYLLVGALAALVYATYVPHAFVVRFTAIAAALLTLLAYLHQPPSPLGFVLLLLGVALLNLEFLLPTFGAAGSGGIAATVVGSWWLLEPATRALSRPGYWRLAVAASGTLLLLAAVLRGVRRRTLPS
jgi:membrane-bound serine protease (ClpP class)